MIGRNSLEDGRPHVLPCYLHGSLVLGLLVAFAPARALAQAPPSPQPAPPAQAPPAAQTPPEAESKAARADALFQEGKKLLELGQAAEACDLLGKSDAIEPTVSTIGLLAACHEQQGLLATALREYRATEKRAAAAGDKRAEYARQRAAAIEPQVPRLVIRIAIAVPKLEVLHNQQPVPDESLGAEILVDPGSHEIVVRAPERREWKTTVIFKPGSRYVAVVPALEPIALPPPPVPAPPPTDGRRVGGFVAGGLGLAGIAIGSGLGIAAIRQNNDSNAIHTTCKTPADCAPGRDARDAAFRSAAGSTISFIAGGVALGTGIVLLALPKSAAPAARAIGLAPFAGPNGGGALAHGRF